MTYMNRERQGRTYHDLPLEKPACRPPLLSLKVKYEIRVEKRYKQTNELFAGSWMLLTSPF